MLEVLNKYFTIDSYDGGSEPGHEIERVLKINDEVHCSGEGVNHSLILKSNNKLFVTHIVVRVPVRGYGEPLMSGVVVTNCKTASELEIYNDFPVDEYEESENTDKKFHCFSTSNINMESCVTLAAPDGTGVSVESLGFKLIESHATDSNLDVTFIAIIGYISSPPSPFTIPNNILRPKLWEDPFVHNLDSVVHVLTKIPMVVAVTSADKLLVVSAQLQKINSTVQSVLKSKGIDNASEESCLLGFAVTTAGDATANILVKQFGSPEKEYFGIIHESGQYVFGEENPTEKQIEEFILNFINQITAQQSTNQHSCSHAGCCSGSQLHSLKQIHSLSSYNEISSSNVCIFVFASWCSVSQSASDFVTKLCEKFEIPLFAVDIDVCREWFPLSIEATPVILLYKNGHLLLKFHSVTAAVLDCDLLETEMTKLLTNAH